MKEFDFTEMTGTDWDSRLPTDLIEHVEQADKNGDHWRWYKFQEEDRNGYLTGAIGTIVIFDGGRAAVEWGADSIWFDAYSPEEAMALYYANAN